jgi:hypothetical protein
VTIHPFLRFHIFAYAIFKNPLARIRSFVITRFQKMLEAESLAERRALP